jgi:cell division protein FtsQ
LQQVGTKAFADAQLVDPRQLPVPLTDLPRRARLGFGRAWILHKKLIVRAVAAGVVLCIGAGLIAEEDKLVGVGAGLYALGQQQAAKMGFAISKINITGQSLTSEATILQALAIPPNTLTFTYDVDAALTRLKAIASIKSATIRKVYPNELQVSVTENVPMARWRVGDKAQVVDENGDPVADDDGSFANLPLVVGVGAADDAMVMIHAMDKYPDLKTDLAALSRIGDRRWDMIYYSGLRVQLPETGVAQALAQLEQEEHDSQLLDRDIETIDMRVPGMVSLKLGELAAKAWADDKKKHKVVTKGDADYETAAERAADKAQ